MGLFGKHNNTNDAAYADGGNLAVPGAGAGAAPNTGGNRLQKGGRRAGEPLHPQQNAPGGNMASGAGAGAGPGPGVGAGGGRFDENVGGGHGNQQVGGQALGGQDYGDQGYGNEPGYGAGGGAGYAGGGNQGAPAQHAMPPRTDAAGNPAKPTGGGGSGQRFVGRVESAVGTMIGSQNLKAKGEQKEQESAALKVQAAEIGEAERLESAALARRERAVAHGAHPQHKHLGGQNPAANQNDIGGGANYGAAGAGGAQGGY
ncbi:hypothetical protein M0805_001024 [Coniferiporia weirii]|nr:hypothetical protein M0805_001024 [Coniferiporia weirii]